MSKEELIAWLGLVTAIINLAVALLNKERRKKKSGSSKKKNRKRK